MSTEDANIQVKLLIDNTTDILRVSFFFNLFYYFFFILEEYHFHFCFISASFKDPCVPLASDLPCTTKSERVF